jgi:hypothetical protein
MKYAIGDQVIVKSTQVVEIIESSEIIDNVSIYYTVSGKSFSESQIVRKHLFEGEIYEKQEIMEMLYNSLSNLNFKVTCKYGTKFDMESARKLMDEINKR